VGRGGRGRGATQSFTERRTGHAARGFARAGSARGLDELLAADAESGDPAGRVLRRRGDDGAHTGASCIPHAATCRDENVQRAGDMLRSADSGRRCARRSTRPTATLAERLLAALDAAEAAGGDYAAGKPRARPSSRASGTSSPRSTASSTSASTTKEPLGELRRLHAGRAHRPPKSHRRDRRPAEEREAALEAGLRARRGGARRLFAHARRGEADEAVALIGELVERTALDGGLRAYEALGLMPPGLLERVRAR
jgi:uncharacterized Ntn-hydrolase superfamily protein